jgi:hypothetical protein
MGVRVLAGIANAEEQPASARVAAVTALFDRGWGKAPQPHTGEDDKDIGSRSGRIVDRRDKHWRRAAIQWQASGAHPVLAARPARP